VNAIVAAYIKATSAERREALAKIASLPIKRALVLSIVDREGRLTAAAKDRIREILRDRDITIGAELRALHLEVHLQEQVEPPVVVKTPANRGPLFLAR
jgi:hypothetical protein